MTAKKPTKLANRRRVFKDERAATVRDDVRIQRELNAERDRVARIAHDAAAVAASERTAAAAKRVFKETLTHRLKRYLGLV